MCREKFNEMDFIKREYELLRFLISADDNLTKKANQTLKTAIDEVINNEEYLKYAMNVKEDMFGEKQLNGVVTITFMLANLEKVKQEFADKLMTILLFEYQDEEKIIPFGLTGENFVGSNYLNHLLANTDYKINKKYGKRISKLVLESIENKFDYWLLTSYFTRRDISIEFKKLVINSLDYDVLSRLINEWEEQFIKKMISDLNLDCINLSDEEVEEFEKELENMTEENISSLNQVVDLINQKLGL